MGQLAYGEDVDVFVGYRIKTRRLCELLNIDFKWAADQALNELNLEATCWDWRGNRNKEVYAALYIEWLIEQAFADRRLRTNVSIRNPHPYRGDRVEFIIGVRVTHPELRCPLEVSEMLLRIQEAESDFLNDMQVLRPNFTFPAPCVILSDVEA